MKYRKKPVVIEAVLITEDMVLDDALPEGTYLAEASYHRENRIVDSFRGIVSTLEGDMSFGVGDWIITGISGEKYPCKPDIFNATYEAA